MGKKGNPSTLNAWSSSLSTASSNLTAVIADLKAASPYSLQDASFGNQRVTAGTTHVTVGHYSGYMGNPGAPITKVETKWVTEKVMTGSGVAQNSGSFMTWLPGTVPSFGNTANTWQGYAASMFANLLQDFLNTVEEIQNTIDQLSKTLSSIADSITQSRKWWHILLAVILTIVAVVIGIAVAVFAPEILGFLAEGLSTLVGWISSFFSYIGEAIGISGIGAIDLAAEGGITFTTEITITITPAAEVTDLGVGETGFVGDLTTTIEATPIAEVASFANDVFNWLKVVGLQGFTDGSTQTLNQFFQNWIDFGNPAKGWNLDELGSILGSLLGIPLAQVFMLGVRGLAIALGKLGQVFGIGVESAPSLSALFGHGGIITIGAIWQSIFKNINISRILPWLNANKFWNGIVIYTLAFTFGDLVFHGVTGTAPGFDLLIAAALGALLGGVDMTFGPWFKDWSSQIGKNLRGLEPHIVLPKLTGKSSDGKTYLPAYKPLAGSGGRTVFPSVTLPPYVKVVPFKLITRGVVYPAEIVANGSLPGHNIPWLTLAPVPFAPPGLSSIPLTLTPPPVITGQSGNPVNLPPYLGVGEKSLPLVQQQQDVIALNADINSQLQAVNDEISVVWYEPDSPARTSTLNALYAQRSELEAEIQSLDHELGIITYETSQKVSSDTIAQQTAILTEQIQMVAQQTLLIDGASIDPLPPLPTF